MATVYIKPGTGTGSGTLSAPYFYSQLGTAETAAGSGGTILFTDGTYSLTSATWAVDDLTYKALNKGNAIIDGTVASLGDSVRLLTQGAAGNSNGNIINGFSFLDFKIKHRLNQNASPINQVVDCTFKSTDYLNMGSTGIMEGYWGSTVIKLTKCSIHYKIHAESAIFYDSNSWVVDGCTIALDIHSNVTALAQGVLTTKKNSIFATNANAKISGSSLSASGTTFCCFHEFGASSSGGTDTIFADPLLVDLVGGDLRLRPSSPCIGTGTTS